MYKKLSLLLFIILTNNAWAQKLQVLREMFDNPRASVLETVQFALAGPEQSWRQYVDELNMALKERTLGSTKRLQFLTLLETNHLEISQSRFNYFLRRFISDVIPHLQQDDKISYIIAITRRNSNDLTARIIRRVLAPSEGHQLITVIQALARINIHTEHIHQLLLLNAIHPDNAEQLTLTLNRILGQASEDTTQIFIDRVLPNLSYRQKFYYLNYLLNGRCPGMNLLLWDRIIENLLTQLPITTDLTALLNNLVALNSTRINQVLATNIYNSPRFQTPPAQLLDFFRSIDDDALAVAIREIINSAENAQKISQIIPELVRRNHDGIDLALITQFFPHRSSLVWQEQLLTIINRSPPTLIMQIAHSTFNSQTWIHNFELIAYTYQLLGRYPHYQERFLENFEVNSLNELELRIRTSNRSSIGCVELMNALSTNRILRTIPTP